MKVGTKSVLWGAHCFFIHPVFVFISWWKLYGFPWDPRLWVAFAVHDLGYWGKPNMDGPEGEEHVWLGANLMHKWFDGWITEPHYRERVTTWQDFCLYHSRFYAKKHDKPYSRLCVADKLAVALEPWWLYLPRVYLSGEIKEYLALAAERAEAGEPVISKKKYAHENLRSRTSREWFDDCANYLRSWAYEHKDLKEDVWTPKMADAAPTRQ